MASGVESDTGNRRRIAETNPVIARAPYRRDWIPAEKQSARYFFASHATNSFFQRLSAPRHDSVKDKLFLVRTTKARQEKNLKKMQSFLAEFLKVFFRFCGRCAAFAPMRDSYLKSERKFHIKKLQPALKASPSKRASA